MKSESNIFIQRNRGRRGSYCDQFNLKTTSELLKRQQLRMEAKNEVPRSELMYINIYFNV
jgi:hypothetical protein